MSDLPDPRRRSLIGAIALTPLALGPAAWAQEAGAQEAGVCRLTPETTAGPFYFDPGLVRADITEGLPGAPLELVLRVVDESCRPLDGARVDVWHCDAAGRYSGYADRAGDTRGETFLRGTQFADAAGEARFGSLWPGWYGGRTPHVHYRVFLDETTVLTSQLFFPDGASETVYQGPGYRDRAGVQQVTNANDGIARRRRPSPAWFGPPPAGGRSSRSASIRRPDPTVSTRARPADRCAGRRSRHGRFASPAGAHRYCQSSGTQA